MTDRRDCSFDIVVNGRSHATEIDPRSLLIDVIRDLGATGARIGCQTGDCGACTVELDGRLAKSCLVLALFAAGSSVTTIEGSDSAIAKHLQQAFIAKKGFQCGYCTSGMIITAVDLLRNNSDPNEAEIRHAISGNLCRCTGYDDIVNAITEAVRTLRAVTREKPADRQ